MKIWQTIKKEKLIILAAASFLLLRNAPLCLLMPIWSHGDEIGHFDYVLKLGRGYLPKPSDFIEPQLFLLHKAHYDSRYVLTFKTPVLNHEELGLAQYSYEAHQPPLPYFLLNLVRKSLLVFNPSLLLQVKLLRMASLLAIALGLSIIYFGLKAAGIHHLYFYIPLLLIPLLVKDLFFSLNTDCFSFLFGSLAAAGAIRLFKNPDSIKNWLWLSSGTVLALWTKIPNAFLLVFWPALLFLLWKKFPNRNVLKRFLIFFLLVLLLSSPWYLYNLSRFSSPFVDADALPYPEVETPRFSLPSLNFFFSSFFTTLFRGEFVWNGTHFQILDLLSAKIFLYAIPILFFLLGFMCFFLPYDRQNLHLFRFLLLGAGISLGAFCFAYFSVGQTPFYLSRYSYGALYLYMLVFTSGWKRLSPKKNLIFIIPLGGLLFYHVVFTIAFLSRVFS